MVEFAEALFVSVAAMMLGLIVAVVGYALYLRKPRRVPNPEAWPRVAIFLPLRGADAALADNLRRLLRQDYPNFVLQIVVDSETDPALTVVKEAAAESKHLRWSTIRRKLPTCSPQCSALIQAVEELDDDVEVVATIDGDVQVHPTWLRELVGQLLRAKVGAAFGNRWFLPAGAQWGALVRYLWIAVTIAPMHYFRYPWAGTFAIRRSVLKSSGLFEHWQHSVVPDAPCSAYLRRIGLKTKFIPSLMMINREGCDLRFCYDFIKRQLTWTRLYNPRYWPVVVLSLATALIWATAALCMLYGALTGGWSIVGYGAASIGLLVGASVTAVLFMEWAVRTIARRRGQVGLRFRPDAIFRLPLAVPLTVWVHVVASVEALWRRRVTWRGVTYDIANPRRARVLSDDTSPRQSTPATENMSL